MVPVEIMSVTISPHPQELHTVTAGGQKLSLSPGQGPCPRREKLDPEKPQIQGRTSADYHALWGRLLTAQVYPVRGE